MFWKLTDLMLAKGLSIFLAIVLIISSFSLTSQANATVDDISVAMKHKKKVSLVAVKNSGDEEVFGVQMKIDDGKIRFVKARGWDRDRIDQQTVIVQTDDRPIKPGKSLIMILIVDNRISSFEWIAFDTKGNILSAASILAKQTQKDEISPNFEEKVQSCNRPPPPFPYVIYKKYMSIDCLIKKAESVGECKAYKNVIVAEFDIIYPTGEIEHVKRHFDEVDACIITYSWQFDDQEACKQAEDSLTCFGKVSEKFGPEVCKVIEQQEKFIDCMKAYLTSSYMSNLSSYVSNLESEARHIAEQRYKDCIDVALGNFAVKQNACRLESLSLDKFSTKELITWKSEGSLLVCLPLKFPEHLDDYEYCLASLGVYSKDLSICDQAGIATAECYGLLAMTEDFVTLETCDELDTGVSFCYMAVAYRLSDINICDMQEIDYNRDNCLTLLRSKFEPYYSQAQTFGPAVCKKIQNDEIILDCAKFYFTSLNNLSWIEDEEVYKKCIDVGFGHHGSKKIACKLESLPLDGLTKNDLIEWTLKGVDICRPFDVPSHLNEDDYCIGSLGVYTKDLSICDRAGTARAECYGLLAITEDFVTLRTCDKLDQGVSFCYMAVAYRLNDISICEMEKVADNRDNCIKLVNSRN